MELTNQQLIELGKKSLKRKASIKANDKLWHARNRWIKDQLIVFYESKGNNYQSLKKRAKTMTLKDLI